jgi:hypothetical protein
MLFDTLIPEDLPDFEVHLRDRERVCERVKERERRILGA